MKSALEKALNHRSQLERWRKAKAQYEKAKTYENAVEVQRTMRNLRDHMRAMFKGENDAGSQG